MQAPPPNWQDYQARQDAEHLRLLALFSRIYAGLLVLCGSLGFIHFFVGTSILTGSLPMDKAPPGEQQIFGTMFAIMGAAYIIISWSLAGLNWIAAWRFEERKGHTYLTVVSAINCLNTPIGTVLGVFSLIVINRSTVRQSFLAAKAPEMEHIDEHAEQPSPHPDSESERELPTERQDESEDPS